jgi:hypothetical protein
MPNRPIRVSRTTAAAIVAALLALLAALGLIQVTDNTTPLPAPTSAPTSAPPTAAPPVARIGHLHEGLAEPGERELGRLPATGERTAGIRGCVTDFNQHNFSSRGDARAQLLVAHWTASANVPGLADVNGIRDWLNRPTTKASANFIVDFEGHCVYTVPITLKAWTQVNANPYSVSIEFVGTGREPGLTRQAIAKGGLVFGQVARQLHIPLRAGASSNCVPTRAGVVDHKSFGACGGGHPDIGTWPLEPLITAARTLGTTSTDRVTCRKINAWRAAGRPGGGQWQQRTYHRLAALRARGIICTTRGPELDG